MTFTEAAVEVLRRAGKPLHFREIAELAIKDNLLSHVGQDPEVTMGQRLAAMAKREEERKVVAIAPDGTFALSEWSPPPEVVVEPVAPPLIPAEASAPPYRPREREPRAIHAQARRRLAELQAEHEEGSEEVEAERRRQDEKRGHKRRYPPPAEVVFEALAVKQSGAQLAELSRQLAQKGQLSEPLAADLPSLVAALLEDNRRRTEAGRKPAFIIDGERVTLVEFPPPSAVPELAGDKATKGAPAAQLLQEARKATARALRKRLGDLDTTGFEQACAQLLEKLSMRDVRVAKRSKEGPLYLARQRRGVSELRVAVKLVRGNREISRQDVNELRRDLSHYSAQLGLLLAAGEAAREARSESSAAGQPPIALYTGDALAEEMVASRVGVSVQLIELAEIDEAFFAGLGRRDERRERREREERAPEQRADAAEGSLSEAQLAVQAEHMPADAATIVAAGEQPSVAETMRRDIPGLAGKVEAPLADEASVAAAAGGDSRATEAKETSSEESAREGRRQRRGREERGRATTPAEQAWGQPAGTLRFATPPGPTVALPRNKDARPATPEQESGAGEPEKKEPASTTPSEPSSGSPDPSSGSEPV